MRNSATSELTSTQILLAAFIPSLRSTPCAPGNGYIITICYIYDTAFGC